MSDDPTREAYTRLAKGVQGFADEMREKGIHVGMGKNPKCVCCGERWPCTAARQETKP